MRGLRFAGWGFVPCIAAVLAGCATPPPEDPAAAAPDAAQLDALARIHPPPTLSKQTPGLHPAACDMALRAGAGEREGQGYRCGTFTVPQDWARPDGRMLDLRYIVLKATDARAAVRDPLLMLAGGPGQSAVLNSTALYARIRPTRDIVLLAQRGAGYGQRLGLEECVVLALRHPTDGARLQAIAKSAPRSRTESPMLANESLGGEIDTICWKHFKAQGLDLDRFDTASSARDAIELVRALGYPAFNLHGISYGTRMAMTVMAMLPQVPGAPVLRSVVLDSSIPPSVHLLATLPLASHEPLVQLLDDCERDAACRAAYPDLGRRIGGLLDRAGRTPIEARGTRITQAALAQQLANLQGARAGFMPRMVLELERGDPATYLALRDGTLGAADAGAARGSDPSDPVQVFIVAAVRVIGAQPASQTQVFGFMGEMGELLKLPAPLPAITAYVQRAYEGAVRERLLALVAAMRPADFESSRLAAQARERAAATPAQDAAADRALRQRTLAQSGVAHYLNQTIHCNEDHGLERYEDALDTLHDMRFPALADMARVHGQAGLCRQWPVAVAPRTVKNPVRSAVPTLILQGAFDRVTPYFMGLRASRELENSRFVRVPQQGHEVWTASNDCVMRIASDFVRDPAAPSNLACLEARRIRWALPAADRGAP